MDQFHMGKLVGNGRMSACTIIYTLHIAGRMILSGDTFEAVVCSVSVYVINGW